MCFCGLIYTQHYIYAQMVSLEKCFPAVDIHWLNTRTQMNNGSISALFIINTGLSLQRQLPSFNSSIYV